MSSPSNEYAHNQEFVGDLAKLAEPVPVRVHTRLRMMSEESARELQGSWSSDRAPNYSFGRKENLPLHPSLLAMGRHYFTW
jgi:hypothetical protein